ncbi:MAG: metal-dependent hydrolase [bacterium]
MDNITHSLVGATLAELALPGSATRAQRRAFFVTGIVAANLPDADLVYTRITPAPLGSLLHHRGHTHTIGGLVVLALLLGAVSLVPAARRAIEPHRARWWALAVAGLLSHLVLDSWNSYGVHPFWPFDSHWIYGDAIFIADPWIWLVLAVSAALNTMRPRGGALLGAALALLIAAAGWRQVIPAIAVAALAVAAVALTLLMRPWPPHRRAGTALGLTLLYVAAMFGVRERVTARVLGAPVSASGARIVDVVLSPEPANPLCWSVMTIAVNEPVDLFTTTRGTVSPFVPSGCGRRASAAVWEEPVRQSLAILRDRYRSDCWVRAWMQFGRAPELVPDAIGDLRYGGARGGFTSMSLHSPADAACPARITPWIPPRSDLVGRPAG